MGTQANVAVVIPAGGSGRRLGGEAKQFRLLHGVPLFVRSLEPFGRVLRVSAAVVAVPAGREEDARRATAMLDQDIDVTIVTGGATRQDSVFNAVAAVSDGIDVIAIHDAVRPFVSPSEIASVIDAAAETGAAALARPVTETLRRGADRRFRATVDRSGIFLMQTPQAFRSDIIRRALETRSPTSPATDDVEIVQASGTAVEIVQGSPVNIKITTPDDWQFARSYWPLWASSAHAEESA